MPRVAIFPIRYDFSQALEWVKRLECQYCANCCRVIKTVYVEHQEIGEIAFRLKQSTRHTKRLMHMEGNTMFTPCPFLGNNSCNIYDIRPKSCQSYPLRNKGGRLACSINCEAGIKLRDYIAERLNATMVGV